MDWTRSVILDSDSFQQIAQVNLPREEQSIIRTHARSIEFAKLWLQFKFDMYSEHLKLCQFDIEHCAQQKFQYGIA
jgi:hypothetical protein